MDDEDSQLLVDDSNFEEISVKYEPSSPSSNFESTGNIEKLSQPLPEKRLKVADPLEDSKSEPSESIGDDNDTMLPTKKRKRIHVNMDPFEREIVKILNANRSQLDYSIRDPDAMFFVSHVPVVKRFSPKAKLDFQIKFMQLLQSYSLPSVRFAMGNQRLQAPSEYSNIDDNSSNGCVS